MDERPNGHEVRWSTSPSAKVKNQVMRSVTAILDELAPERLVKRTDELAEIQQYRTPTGCVLQAPDAAVSVSWFDEPGKDAPLGELHIVVWSGAVKRRGSINQGKGGTVVSDLILRPSQPAPETVLWTTTAGVEYATASIPQKCLALLEEQVARTQA
jgi:hypothetical protein